MATEAQTDVDLARDPIELADRMRAGLEEVSVERLWHRADRYALARGEAMGETFAHAMLHAGRYEGPRLEECPKCGRKINDREVK